MDTNNDNTFLSQHQQQAQDDLARALASLHPSPANPVSQTQVQQTVSDDTTSGDLDFEGLDLDKDVANHMEEATKVSTNNNFVDVSPVNPLTNVGVVNEPTDNVVEESVKSEDKVVIPPVETNTGSLEEIKKKALAQLRPLMSYIELSPEERFEKLLMMLRASDDTTLVPDLYAAANGISNDKLKAQAMLDVINECSYLGSKK
jgi:hypothetical protein